MMNWTSSANCRPSAYTSRLGEMARGETRKRTLHSANYTLFLFLPRVPQFSIAADRWAAFTIVLYFLFFISQFLSHRLKILTESWCSKNNNPKDGMAYPLVVDMIKLQKAWAIRSLAEPRYIFTFRWSANRLGQRYLWSLPCQHRFTGPMAAQWTNRLWWHISDWQFRDYPRNFFLLLKFRGVGGLSPENSRGKRW
jgi:hypothetical protein